ncbi:MAG TPA: cysteine desulfurase NifS, partial [Armatimonadetes bacterium]|nr:cysteine desulfurase NifS [Armatimonadota bacterium]
MRYYADSAATTPLHPEARRVMDEWNQREFGNASSLYAEGRRARAALDEAHETLAQHWGCLFGEVLFTGSGTEAANLAILGFALANPTDRRTIVLGAGDHHCVTHTAGWLGRLGYQVRWAPIDREGRTRMDALPEIITEDVALVSVMMANNELGTIQPLAEIVAQARAVGAHIHTDAVQAFPTLLGSSWTVDDLGVDMVSISAHKFGGPKGIGALYVRGGTPLEPVVVGGGQERDMRAGTENVALALGMAEALRQALADPNRD